MVRQHKSGHWRAPAYWRVCPSLPSPPSGLDPLTGSSCENSQSESMLVSGWAGALGNESFSPFINVSHAHTRNEQSLNPNCPAQTWRELSPSISVSRPHSRKDPAPTLSQCFPKLQKGPREFSLFLTLYGARARNQTSSPLLNVSQAREEDPENSHPFSLFTGSPQESRQLSLFLNVSQA